MFRKGTLVTYTNQLPEILRSVFAKGPLKITSVSRNKLYPYVAGNFAFRAKELKRTKK